MEKKVKKLIKRLEAENHSRYIDIKFGDMSEGLIRKWKHKYNYTAEIIQQLKNCL